jgi:hypothetical protein
MAYEADAGLVDPLIFPHQAEHAHNIFFAVRPPALDARFLGIAGNPEDFL